jgi:diacylglycerol kinase family enzyme
MIGGDVIYRQGKKITVTSDADIATEIDGDPGPSLPVEINVIPHAVRVIVAEGAKPAGMRKQIMRVLR